MSNRLYSLAADRLGELVADLMATAADPDTRYTCELVTAPPRNADPCGSCWYCLVADPGECPWRPAALDPVDDGAGEAMSETIKIDDNGSHWRPVPPLGDTWDSDSVLVMLGHGKAPRGWAIEFRGGLPMRNGDTLGILGATG